ncbi:MAG: TIGR02300 family protein [Alphaproteobacteria bacterium]
MAKPEWGKKHSCPSCGAKFYDMQAETPLTCPKCDTVFEPERVLKPRRARPEDDKPVKKEVEKAKEDDDEDEDLLLDDSDDDVAGIELDDDDDDAEVVVDIVTDKAKEDT